MKRRKNSHAKVLYLILFMGSSICCTGCSTKEPPPSEVIEIETIEILDLNKNDGALEPSTAEKEVDKAFKKADVIIDFTTPNCTLEILKIATKLKKKVSIGAKIKLKVFEFVGITDSFNKSFKPSANG